MDQQQQQQQQQQVATNNNQNNNNTGNQMDTMPIPTDEQSTEEKNNLIVNYIPTSMNEMQLRGLFQPYGELESVKLMTDKYTKSSLGYGFVKYVTQQEAEKAIAALNGKQIENKILKVSHARPSSTVKRANLYVAYLSPAIKDKFQLKSLFESFGKIADVKMLQDENGENKGVGFVRFENRKDAERAIASLNGNNDPNICNGSHPLVVKYSEADKRKRRQQRRRRYNNNNGRYNNRMSNNPYQLSYRNQMDYRYNPMGTYTRPPNPYNAYQGYAVADPYSTAVAANTAYGYGATAAYPAITPTQSYNTITAPTTTNAVSNEGGYCLFIYNLPPETDDNLLYRLFGPYGAIVSVKVVRDPSTGLCKGYSFVNFSKYEEAAAAISSLNGNKFKNKYLQVSFKKAN